MDLRTYRDNYAIPLPPRGQRHQCPPTDYPEAHCVVEHREGGAGLGQACPDHARKLHGIFRCGCETAPGQKVPHSRAFRRPQPGSLFLQGGARAQGEKATPLCVVPDTNHRSFSRVLHLKEQEGAPIASPVSTPSTWYHDHFGPGLSVL